MRTEEALPLFPVEEPPLRGLARSSPARFLKFHKANPEVYSRLRAMSLALLRRGVERWGARNLWEKLRFDLMVETTDEQEVPKLNDHYIPYYARLLMKKEPSLRGFFEIRIMSSGGSLPQEAD